MIEIRAMCARLRERGIDFFTGVPDSYLNDFCTELLKLEKGRHVIAANEGNAVAIAAGHYFATGRAALVYLQNSGLGNAVNPLVSLADRGVYDVPMLLLIGWRGQPGTRDWAQHVRQGEMTPGLLEQMGIPYRLLPDQEAQAAEAVAWAADGVCKEKKTHALVVPKGTLSGRKSETGGGARLPDRRGAMEVILNVLPPDVFYCATTGRTTRELAALRKERNESSARDFLNVGAMGHTSSVALGMALARPESRFVVLDGDGAAIMHLGAFATVGKENPPNLLHIVLNNGVHESVGGQPTAGDRICFTQIAEACGYATVKKAAESKQEVEEACRTLFGKDRTGFLEIRIGRESGAGLPPLTISHKEAAERLVREWNG